MRGAAGGQLRVVKRLLANGSGEACGQLAGGVDVAEEHIGQGGTGLDAGAPRLKNGRYMLGSPLEFQRASGQHDENHRLSGGGDGFQ